MIGILEGYISCLRASRALWKGFRPFRGSGSRVRGVGGLEDFESFLRSSFNQAFFRRCVAVYHVVGL